jgi:hypothetical protein
MDDRNVELLVRAWNKAEGLTPEWAYSVGSAARTALPELEPWIVGKSDSGPAVVGLASRRMYCMRDADRDNDEGLETLSTPAEKVTVSVFDTFRDLHRLHPAVQELWGIQTRIWTFSGRGWSVDVVTEFDVDDRGRGDRLEVTCRRLAVVTGSRPAELDDPLA